MKAYEKHEVYNPKHPEDMEEILSYLNAHGELRAKPAMVERLYHEFSMELDYAEDARCMGWMSVSNEVLERFADWLERVDL